MSTVHTYPHARTLALGGFEERFGRRAEALFSAPGRTELAGNHTDHEGGMVIAAAVDMDMLGAAARNDSGMLRVISDSGVSVAVSIDAKGPRDGEKYTSAALVRGVAEGLAARGVGLCGADIYVLSHVPLGGGLSSSAAYEVLIATALCGLFGGSLPPLELAKLSMEAENRFFGKPSGLMDQAASALGGIVALDFLDPAAPALERIDADLTSIGYALCMVDCGADHAGLTMEYAAVTDELRRLCALFGKTRLIDVPEDAFFASLGRARRAVGDRAVLRAMHIYAENARVERQKAALKAGDIDSYLALVRESGRSSAMYLQNIIPAGSVAEQKLMVTLALCERALGGRGACRVHGGGFAGAAQAYVPLGMLPSFIAAMESTLGEGCCTPLTIRREGGIRVM